MTINEAEEAADIDWEPLESLFSKSNRSIFVIPHYRNKSWIKDAVNKIAGVKDLNKLTIYGMSNWMDIEDISFSQRIFLDLHLPVYQNVDHNKAEIKFIDRTYLSRYKMLPTSEEAYVGYDVVNFITKSWMNHGQNAIIESSRSVHQGNTVQFDIQPIYRGNGDFNVDYFQNVLIQMYRYTEGGLRLSSN